MIMSETNSIGDLLREAARHLAGLPHSEPRLEAQLLLMEATGFAREQLFAWPERVLVAEQAAGFAALLQRRLDGEPVAYIRERQAFWSLDLRVTPDTLIPRPETELMVEIALDLLPSDQPLLVADAGTGSGAIAAALAIERPGWTLIAIERSGAAAAVATDNLRRCAVANTRVIRADWLAPIAPATLDAIIGNPPYIRRDDPHLRQGDLPSEPLNALASGTDGLDAIRCIAKQASACLRSTGLLALEHGFDQSEAVRTILVKQGFVAIDTRQDLAGLPRATIGQRPADGLP